MNREPRAEQPPHEQFDHYRRNYNDAATWLAETLDGSMLTRFEYTFDGRELYADDGSPIGNIFLDSLREAESLVAKNPAMAFELRRRKLELEEYGAMLRMARGELPNTMVVVSDFPSELMGASTDVGGYNVARKQTMLRILSWDGTKLTMYSQSLDGSNRQALEKIYREFGQTPAPGELLRQRINQQLTQGDQHYLASRLTGAYDSSLEQQYGGKWHAGRREQPRDTYQFVLSQHQLLDHFAVHCLQRRPTDVDLYNLAALMKKLFEGRGQPQINTVTEMQVVMGGIASRDLEWQLAQAGQEARSKGVTFTGCGVSVGGGLSILDQLSGAGFGNNSVASGDRYGSLTFNCPSCKRDNDRPYGRLIPNCLKCGANVSCKPPKLDKPKQPLRWKSSPGLGEKLKISDQPPSSETTPAKVGKQAMAFAG